MQTLNTLLHEDYYHATTSHDSWHCAASSTDPQEQPLQSCPNRSLAISSEHSPMLDAEDLFSSLDTASTSQDPSSSNPDGTPISRYDSSAAKHSAGSPTSSGRSLDEKGHRVQKRQRNTEAARRYRQRKVDKVSELEEALQLMTMERDDLRLRLARSEAETGVLRSLVGRRE